MVRDMAEEILSRGYEVWVLAGEHQGDRNGVRLTSDFQVLAKTWDLIIVFGGDVYYQNMALANANKITSPILHLLILPSESPVCLGALQTVTYIGCDTHADWNHVAWHGVRDKARPVRLSINEKTSFGTPGFREKYNIKTKHMFLSSGGYWPNKAMGPLVTMFNALELPDTTLVLTGYDNRHNLMPAESEFVKPFMIDDRSDVMSALLEADLYILHSYSEGFGLVLLEAMLNKTPWIARDIAGASTLRSFGTTYKTDSELMWHLGTHRHLSEAMNTGELNFLNAGRNYILENRLNKHTVDDIEKILLHK